MIRFFGLDKDIQLRVRGYGGMAMIPRKCEYTRMLNVLMEKMKKEEQKKPRQVQFQRFLQHSRLPCRGFKDPKHARKPTAGLVELQVEETEDGGRHAAEELSSIKANQSQ